MNGVNLHITYDQYATSLTCSLISACQSELVSDYQYPILVNRKAEPYNDYATFLNMSYLSTYFI